jgi:NodT family efflux transporter outer membrane factor (OMF) lipoprotein
MLCSRVTRWSLALTIAPFLFVACTVGPKYVRPAVVTPAAYKEMDGWKVAQPKDDALRGAWWEIFRDPRLSALEELVNIDNQNLAVAAAQLQQARAAVDAARASYFPTIAIGLGVSRARQPAVFGGRTTNTFSLPIDAAWEIDLWGRIRRTVESQQAAAQASAADLESARLSAQATLAQSYLTLRVLDAQRHLLDETVRAYQKSLDLTRNRYASGVASNADVVQAESQLKTSQAQAIDVGVQRAQLEHAIAALTGQPASVFALPAAPLATPPPQIPVGVPSEVLERRPDIASAERRVAAANAQIGVADAAFYPTLTLSASGGFDSSKISNWLSWPSRLWSIGPAISQVVFDGGLRRAQKNQTLAAYDADVASYRQTVLTAFQEVEDNLAALRILEEEARVQEAAVVAAQQSVALTTNQYKAGTVSYLEVVVTQAVALANERVAVDILGRRMAAAVLLVKALGGGWNASALSSAAGIGEEDDGRP